MDTAADQLRRLLHIIPKLADGNDHPIAQLAAIAGVKDGRQLITDLQSLIDRFDVPGAFVEGVQVWIDDRNVSVVSSHFRRPMRLTIAELCALELGLAVLRAERPVSEGAVIDRTLERLRKIITALRENAEHEGLRTAALGGVDVREQLAAIRRALDSHHMIRIRYRSGASTEASWRTVCPYGVLFASGMWYMAAHSMDTHTVRCYRLDRIEATEPTDETYEIPAGFAFDSVARDGRVLHGTPISMMRVRYSARIVPWIAEREGIAPDADGALVMEHPVHDIGWAVRHVLQYGPDAEVLAPPGMRALVAERLDEMAAMT
jgi:predicted DNA-binding transcriptional regulator YafY